MNKKLQETLMELKKGLDDNIDIYGDLFEKSKSLNESTPPEELKKIQQGIMNDIKSLLEKSSDLFVTYGEVIENI
jgi:hypothetical protein